MTLFWTLVLIAALGLILAWASTLLPRPKVPVVAVVATLFVGVLVLAALQSGQSSGSGSAERDATSTEPEASDVPPPEPTSSEPTTLDDTPSEQDSEPVPTAVMLEITAASVGRIGGANLFQVDPERPRVNFQLSWSARDQDGSHMPYSSECRWLFEIRDAANQRLHMFRGFATCSGARYTGIFDVPPGEMRLVAYEELSKLTSELAIAVEFE